MKNSIESIWKEGFLKEDVLVIPKLNDLYNQKSIHFVDKYRRMFILNLWAIVIGSFLFLAVSFLLGIPIIGIGFFVILNSVAFVNGKFLFGMKKIDNTKNSYQYLKIFERWMNKKLSVNRKMAMIYYPLMFLLVTIGLAQSDGFQVLYHKLIQNLEGNNIVDWLPGLLWLPILVISLLLLIFGQRIYDWDANVIYGSMYKKLQELIGDMEELSGEQYYNGSNLV